MKKIKLNKLEVQNSALTREQLKGIMGGSGSSSYTYDPCEGKLQGSQCMYSNSDGNVKYGLCMYLPTSDGLVCT